MAKNPPSKDDLLWQKEVADVTPLEKGAGKISFRLSPLPVRRGGGLSAPDPGFDGGGQQPLHPFDPALYRKISRGRIPIDREVDLHGMTRAEAFEVLGRTLSSAFESGQRRLLVITGKGQESGGVLKNALPGWLASSRFSRLVSSFEISHRRHGGEGAYYVLLRKRK